MSDEQLVALIAALLSIGHDNTMKYDRPKQDFIDSARWFVAQSKTQPALPPETQDDG